MPEVMVARADLCQFGLVSEDEKGVAPAKKPTRFMTNSLEVYKMLSKKCDGRCPRHVQLMEGRAKAASVYPRQLCRAALRGTARQMRVDRGNLMSFKCIDGQTEVMAVDFEQNDWQRYWDDMSGKELRGDLVRAARAEEIETIRKMRVWVKVDREQCFRETGRPPIKLRWVDVNKGDEARPNHRSRIDEQQARPVRSHSAHRAYRVPYLTSGEQSEKEETDAADGPGHQEGVLLCARDEEDLHRAPTRGCGTW